ncbi:MAG: PfkB family carbohydrate kinase, partial [Candidatus Hodarchaeota archaeon]
VHDLNKRLPVIYSPDLNIHELTKWRLTQIFDKITILICTEDELRLIEERMKQNCDEILINSKRLKYIVSMIERSRIIIFSKEFKVKVSEGPAEEALSEDFWHDAFRAGLIYGISLKKPIEEAARIGSALASYAVETRENHQYSPSLEQVSLRAFEVKTSKKEK